MIFHSFYLQSHLMAFLYFLMAISSAQLLSACQKSAVQQTTNVFENSQLNFAFDYCRNINDGRGYTVGIVGFTTGTGDANTVISAYSQLSNQTHEFDAFTTRLTSLASSGDSAVSGLDGFCQAWKLACNTTAFRSTQVAKLYQLYYTPSQNLADSLGLQLPISRGQFYDAAVQHGIGPESYSLNSMASLVKAATPSNGGDETKWIAAFMTYRKKILCANGQSTPWCNSKSRVASYEYIMATNPTFNDSISALDNDGAKISISCNLALEDTYIPSNDQDGNTSTSLNVVGLAVGLVFGVVGVAAIGYWIYRMRRNKKNRK